MRHWQQRDWNLKSSKVDPSDRSEIAEKSHEYSTSNCFRQLRFLPVSIYGPQLRNPSAALFILTPITMAASVASTPAALPAYSNDPEPPSYLVEPARHEQRVAFAPLLGGRALRAAIDASETYVRRTRTGGITLALKGQSSNPRIQPTYGRRGLIEGELSLADPDNIIAVKIKVRAVPVFLSTFGGVLLLELLHGRERGGQAER